MHSIKKNYLYNLSYRILTILIPMITTPYISRILGARNIGINSFLSSVEEYFLMFAAMGTAFYGKREIARFRDNKEKYSRIFWEIEFLSIVTTMLCLGAWLAFSLFQKEYRVLYYILTINILAVAFDISWLFAALERFDRIVLRNLAIRVLSIVLLFTIVKTKEDLWLYMVINAGGALFGNISLWIKLSRFVDKPHIYYKSISIHFKNTLVYFLPTIATTVYTVFDKTMLQLITKDLCQNGYYEQAVKLCRIPLAALLSMDTVMGARMSYLVEKKENQEIKNRLETSLRLVFFLGVPMVIGLDMIIEKMVPWFFGDGYNPIIYLVYVYSPLILCIGINNCLAEQYLTPIGKRKQTATIVIISALLNLLLNFLLIPRFQAIGAAIASVFSEAFIAIAYIVMSRQIISIKQYMHFSIRDILAACLMVMITISVSKSWDSSILSTIGQIILGSFIYFTELIFLKDKFMMNICIGIRRKRGN